MDYSSYIAVLLIIYAASASIVLAYPYQYERNAGIANFNGNANLKGNYAANANALSTATVGQAFGGDKYLPPATGTTAAPPIITKQFYMVSAEEDREDTKKHFVIGRPQKNYRVVFIKAPTADNVKLSAEYAPQEEKTVIYVLSKKPDDVEVEDLTAPTTEPSKPDIFFIKYKTPEEADTAQKEIQEQYDQLGGISEFIDKGIVPVKSVIGSFNINNNIAANGGYEYKKNGGSWDQTKVENVLQRMRYYFK